MAIAFSITTQKTTTHGVTNTTHCAYLDNVFNLKANWLDTIAITKYWDIPGYEYGCLCFSFDNDPSIFTIWNI